MPSRFLGLVEPEEKWKERLKWLERGAAEETPERQAARLEDAKVTVERRAEEAVKALNDVAATHAYQACIAVGFWADRDLHASEWLWLRGELGIASDTPLPLPPVPVRKERENAFGETVKETVGIAAPVVTASGKAKERATAMEALDEGEIVIVTDHEGSWAFVRPSEDTMRQVLLKVDEWIITDKATAQGMIDAKEEAKLEAERRTMQPARLGISKDCRPIPTA
ncbi:hypothetical protein [Mesorhizobium abyssinicae]|uniref:hypothetical protein n=1 Tax=Mesorhizobium abyssinicae TaxID=1209958 RepID=UPI00339592A3